VHGIGREVLEEKKAITWKGVKKDGD